MAAQLRVHRRRQKSCRDNAATREGDHHFPHIRFLPRWGAQ
jgi:hypothetical protein